MCYLCCNQKTVVWGLESGKWCFVCFCCWVLFVHCLCFCFSISESHSEVHVPHLDTVNVASVVLFCCLISFCKFWGSYTCISEQSRFPCLCCHDFIFQYHLIHHCRAWKLCIVFSREGTSLGQWPWFFHRSYSHKRMKET